MAASASASTSSFEEIILRNLTKLCVATTYTKRLLDRCLEERILTPDQWDAITVVERTEYERNRTFYLYLRKCEEHNVIKLIQIMQEDKTLQQSCVLNILKIAIQCQDDDLSDRTSVLQLTAPAVVSPNIAASGPQLLESNLGSQSLGTETPSTMRPEISDLHSAIAAENVNLVNEFLYQGVDVDRADDYGQTPLHLAIKLGLQNMVELMLRHRASPNVSLEDNVTPLHLAVKGSFEGIAKILLDHGANVNAATSEVWETPLVWAIRIGKCSTLKLLLRNGADVNMKSNHNASSLHTAASSGNADVLDLLIAKGAQSQIKALDKYECTPLHIAAESEFKNVEVIASLLINGASVHAKDIWESTPLHRAAHSGHHGNVKVLIQYAGVGINSSDLQQRTPLHLAAMYGRYLSVKFLVEGKADINFKDALGRTPLDCALLFGEYRDSERIAQYLIGKGATKGSH